MSWPVLIFWFLASIIACSAVMMVWTTNIVRAAISLFITLAAIALLYFMLGFAFLGSVQLMVYVGGTLVLFVFGVMLTAQAPADRLKTRPIEAIAATLVCLGFFGLILQNLPKTAFAHPESNVDTTPKIQDVGRAFLNVTPAKDLPGYTKAEPGAEWGGFLFAFEILSVHLLVVLVGAAYLARGKRSTDGKGS